MINLRNLIYTNILDLTPTLVIKIPKIGVVMGLVLPSTLSRLTPLVVPEITSGSGAWQTPLVSSWIPSITRGQR